MTRARASTCAVLAALLATACSGPVASPEPLPAFAAPAETLRAGDLAPAADPEVSEAADGSATIAPTPGPSASAIAPTSPSTDDRAVAASTDATPVDEGRVLATVRDATGDFLLQEPPGHADLVAVEVRERGQSVIVVVQVAGDVPAALADREVMGIGVDVYLEDGSGESDYQLFADGGADGWQAFLQTPEGFVSYPGSFRIGGDLLVFEVPFSRIGDPASAEFRVFADWSQGGQLVNDASSDAAPDDGRASFTR